MCGTIFFFVINNNKDGDDIFKRGTMLELGIGL